MESLTFFFIFMRMEIISVFIFGLGYLAIAFEHPLKINKTASALLTGVLVWVVFALVKGEGSWANYHIIWGVLRRSYFSFRRDDFGGADRCSSGF